MKEERIVDEKGYQSPVYDPVNDENIIVCAYLGDVSEYQNKRNCRISWFGLDATKMNESVRINGAGEYLLMFCRVFCPYRSMCPKLVEF